MAMLQFRYAELHTRKTFQHCACHCILAADPIPSLETPQIMKRESVCVLLGGGGVIVGKSIVRSRGEVERETNHPDQTLDIDAETMLT
jgi:hypothetical protein